MAHSKMRKYLAQAFSPRSLAEQECLVQRLVDEFIRQLRGMGEQKQTFNIAPWFNMLTFDIIGDLTFGVAFEGVKSGRIHPWITRITGAMTQGALADCFRRFPILAKVLTTVASGHIQRVIADTKINEKYSIDPVRKRIASKTNRKDLLTRILAHRDKELISDVQIAAHASDFVLAGSETTATALSCITYYVLLTPLASSRLVKEIRGNFKAYHEINATSTSSLQYLNTGILEGLRIYPPLPLALPRVVPKGSDIVDSHFLPANVFRRV